MCLTRSDALATSNPVRSMIMVWKLSKLSRRPWAISGWYGVYWVVLKSSIKETNLLDSSLTHKIRFSTTGLKYIECWL